MLNSDYNIRLCRDFTHFTAREFKCECGCGYPTKLDAKLLYRLEVLRSHYKKPIIITSGLRCQKYNDSLVGSSKTSAHLKGNAADIYISGVNPKNIVKFWQKNKFGYAYCGTKNMGNCAHVSV